MFIKFNLINKYYLYLISLVIIYFVLNYKRLFFNTFNLEWFFIELINSYNIENYYFNNDLFQNNQANSVIYPFLLSLIVPNFENNYENLIYFRIINLLAIVLLIFFSIKIKILESKNLNTLFTLIIFCPIINIYIFRIYPDILSFSFAYLSFVFLTLEKKIFLFLSLITACFSFLLKPVAIIIFPLFFFYIFKNKYLKKNALFLIFTYGLFIVISFFVYLRFFDIKIFSEYYSNTYMRFNLINSTKNFVSYLNYSILLIFPFSIIYSFKFFISKKIKIMNKFLILIVSFLISYFILNLSGEMNYGYIEKLFNFKNSDYFFITINNIISISFISLILKDNKGLEKNLLYIFLIVVLFLSILIARPVQRYLMYAMPLLFYLAILIFNNYKFKNWLIILYLSIFVSINIGQLVYQSNTDNIINTFKNHVISNNLESKTHPGQFYHSIGYLFKDFMINIILQKKNNHIENYNFQITQCEFGNHILKEDLYVMGKKLNNFCFSER